MRLFYAVGLDEPVKNALCSAMERMRSCCMKGRVTPRENMHITLAFLGEVVPQRLSAAKDAMNDVTAEPFSAEIGGAVSTAAAVTFTGPAWSAARRCARYTLLSATACVRTALKWIPAFTGRT